MKYWRGYLTAAIFAAITWAIMQIGSKFTQLVDMVYPYVMRTAQTMLAQWSGGVDFVLWQVLAIVLGILVLASAVLMIILKWNPVQWFGWVLSGASILFLLYTVTYGLNYYAGSIAEDIRLEVVEYNTEDLTDAAIYYRDKANALASQVGRGGTGSASFADFATLADQAADGFTALTYDYSYSIFAGCKLPVKELGWADWYTAQGVTGVTMGITGEAAVNTQIPDLMLPYAMCREMAHRMCISDDVDANFAAFLAAQANSSTEFQYSAYAMAYYSCYNALLGSNTVEATAAAARVSGGVSDQLYQDLTAYAKFFGGSAADTVMTSGIPAGLGVSVDNYDDVSDLLVAWYIQEIYLPSIAIVERTFDPMDENQVDLTGIVNAKVGEVYG